MRRTGVIAIALVTVASSAISAPAIASTPAPEPTLEPASDSAYLIQVGDADPIPIPDTSPLFPEAPTPDDSTIQPLLIDDPGAWVACFGPLFNPTYTLKPLGLPHFDRVIHLTCGPHDTKTYGWHHIQDHHQSEWQTRLDAASTAGAGPADTWDDLMALSTELVLAEPWWYTVEYSGKRCFTQHIAIFEADSGATVLEFWPTVIVSMTNDRVITSYPTTNEDCSRQASWA